MAEINSLVRIRSGAPIRIQSVEADSLEMMEVRSQRLAFPICKRGVVRQDAELIQTYHEDAMLIADLGKTLSAYSTKAKVLVASVSLTPTIQMDFSNFNYYIVMRGLGIPEYDTATKQSGRCDYCASTYLWEVVDIEPWEIKTVDGKSYTARNLVVMSNGSFGREIYWTSASAWTIANNVTYGTNVLGIAPTVSGSTLTIKSPTYGITGNTKQMTSGAWSHITDIRYQYVIEVWRAPKGHGEDGWGIFSSGHHVLDCVASEDHTLT